MKNQKCRPPVQRRNYKGSSSGTKNVTMRSAKEDEPCTKRPTIDLVSAVQELHALSSRELSKLITHAKNGTIQWTKEDRSSLEINVEDLARYLPMHLISVAVSVKPDEQLVRYMLGGMRLLNAFCDISYRHSKLEQVLFDDVNTSTRMLDSIFYMIMFLSCFIQKIPASSIMVLLHSALLASSLYFLTTFTPEWHELTLVLLAHPKVDIFTGGIFLALRVVIYSLQVKLSAQHTDTHVMPNVAEVYHLCQHCEASLQFLQSLCQQKLFRERLVKNKELCEKGGVLLLVQDIMKLPICEDSRLMAVVYRLKSKVLSIMLHLCEVESISFLDLPASTTAGLDLAKSTVSEVLEVVKMMFCDLNGVSASSFKGHPRGILQLNAMRLTEILSDDSNFQSTIAFNLTEALTTVFLLPQGEFLSSWCSSAREPLEEEVTLDYDSLSASGRVLGVVPTSHVSQSVVTTSRAPQTPYAHQRISLLVKIVANLSCFVPDLCKEKEGLFLNLFLRCLRVAHSGGAERVAVACRNLRFLFVHAKSLVPGYLNEDDVQLLREFIRRLEAQITPQQPNIHQVKEIHSRGKLSLPAPKRLSPEGHDRSGNQDEGVSVNLAVDQLKQLNLKKNGENQPNNQRTNVPETSAAKRVEEGDRNAQNIEINGSDSSTMQLKNSFDRTNNVEGVPEEEMVRSMQSEEKQLKRRKRNIMNNTQIAMIENALRDEPDMQRKAASVELWAEKLSAHGSHVTASQLKNWLNNRKAKLARAAAKDVRVPSGEDNVFTDKQGGSGTDPVSDSPKSPANKFFDTFPSAPKGTHQKDARGAVTRNESSEPVPKDSFKREHGQYVMLTDGKGEEIGKGCIHLAKGIWFGVNLEELGLCVVDVTYLKVDASTQLLHPCDATGTTFAQAEMILDRKRVLWDSNDLLLLQHSSSSCLDD